MSTDDEVSFVTSRRFATRFRQRQTAKDLPSFVVFATAVSMPAHSSPTLFAASTSLQKRGTSEGFCLEKDLSHLPPSGPLLFVATL